MSDPQQPEEPQRTVFGAPDQERMISKIDAVADDDLSSSFFDNSLQDVEDAAVRMFDIGIRTLTDDTNVPIAAFGTRREPGAPAAEATDQQVAPGAVGIFADPSVRTAFILGGPDAIAG
ncbi:MAG: hypothetical protein GC156_03590 [Actinomycetales bacterium]|nr:hypothetical protein [Actinomycetales bacterium]